jgi:hypothetical protein
MPHMHLVPIFASEQTATPLGASRRISLLLNSQKPDLKRRDPDQDPHDPRTPDRGTDDPGPNFRPPVQPGRTIKPTHRHQSRPFLTFPGTRLLAGPCAARVRASSMPEHGSARGNRT